MTLKCQHFFYFFCNFFSKVLEPAYLLGLRIFYPPAYRFLFGGNIMQQHLRRLCDSRYAGDIVVWIFHPLLKLRTSIITMLSHIAYYVDSLIIFCSHHIVGSAMKKLQQLPCRNQFSVDRKLLLCSVTSPRIALAILVEQNAGFALFTVISRFCCL